MANDLENKGMDTKVGCTSEMSTSHLIIGLAGFMVLFSGCTATPSTGPVSGEDLHFTEVTGLAGPYIPLVINETVSNGEVQWRVTFRDECPVSGPQWGTIKTFSRRGFERSMEYHFRYDASQTVNRTIPIQGEAPWLVAGIGPVCASLWSSTVGGVAEGWNARFTRAQDEWQTKVIDLLVPVGSQTAEATWLPGPRVWWLIQMFPEDRDGHEYGNVSATDANGNVTRWDRYSFDGHDGWWHAFELVDGRYSIRLQLEQPAVVETRWTWHIDYMELPDTLCPYGFEWDVCAD